jgi:hypothetical protein
VFVEIADDRIPLVKGVTLLDALATGKPVWIVLPNTPVSPRMTGGKARRWPS